MDIGPGDWVEFHKAYMGLPVPLDGPQLGCVLKVRVVAPTEDLRGGTVDGAQFEPPIVRDAAIPVECLRPIYRPKESLIQSLLEPVDEMEPA